jgi:phosphohistidine phosphatase
MKNNKVLHIVRHSKSSWKYENALDIDRPLKNKGIRNTYIMAERIKERVRPDLIISSPADRAIHTAIIYARMLSYPVEKIQLNDILYNNHEGVILNLILKTDDAYDTIFVVGHNPTFTNLANYFFEKSIDNIPTSGIVTVGFNTNEWKSISKENVESVHIDFPKKSKDY